MTQKKLTSFFNEEILLGFDGNGGNTLDVKKRENFF